MKKVCSIILAVSLGFFQANVSANKVTDTFSNKYNQAKTLVKNNPKTAAKIAIGSVVTGLTVGAIYKYRNHDNVKPYLDKIGNALEATKNCTTNSASSAVEFAKKHKLITVGLSSTAILAIVAVCDWYLNESKIRKKITGRFSKAPVQGCKTKKEALLDEADNIAKEILELEKTPVVETEKTT